MQITFIGTGLMGNPMAARLLAAGHELIVYNRTLEKTRFLKEQGAKVALTANEAVNLSNVVVLMLTNAEAVNEVLFSNKNQDCTGKTIIQMSTILPEESKIIAEKVKALHGDYIEAPVLGSIPQATDGKLMILTAGDEQIVNKFRDLLSEMGQVFYFGEIKKAAAVKLALNHLIAALSASFSVSLGIVQKEGIETEKFMEVLRKSALYAPTYDAKLQNYITRDFSRANFPVKHLLKDIKLVRTEAESLGINTTSINALQNIIEETLQDGRADEDYSALFTSIVNHD